MDNMTRQIAHYAHAASFQLFPPEVVEAARARIIDALGCALGGSDCEAARIGRRLASGGMPDLFAGRIVGSTTRTTAEIAAFTNTSMIRYMDFNDGHHGGHPSDMLGALLALAELSGADGPRLLGALVVGYEVALRFIRATKLRELGWDQGFAIGIGTAAAVGHLLGLSADRIGHAIAITATANVPLRASRAGQLSHWKGAATAFACRNGVFAVLLAADGMTGPDKPFEGRHGLWDQITGPFALEPFADEGGAFLVTTSHFKFWPVDANAQAAVFAALQLRNMLRGEQIAHIDIATYWSSWHENASEPEKWNPMTRETADHSIPYVFARAFVDGTIGKKSFEDAAVLDPSLRPLMAKIGVHVDDEIEAIYQASFPKTVIMRLDVTTADGHHHLIEIKNPRGQPQNPMNGAEVDDKFLGQAEPVLGTDRARGALDAWRNIDRCQDFGRPFALLQFDS